MADSVEFKFVVDREAISKLAKDYRLALEKGDQGVANASQSALKELADAQAAMSRAAILSAFVNDSEA